MTKKELENKIAEEIKNLSNMSYKELKDLAQKIFNGDKNSGLLLFKFNEKISQITAWNKNLEPTGFPINQFITLYGE